MTKIVKKMGFLAKVHFLINFTKSNVFLLVFMLEVPNFARMFLKMITLKNQYDKKYF